MDYAIYLSAKMKEHERENMYEDLLFLTKLDVNQDIRECIRLQYKLNHIEAFSKDHFKYQVLKELKYKIYYSSRMYQYYVSIITCSKNKLV